jgi:hypothetical protein
MRSSINPMGPLVCKSANGNPISAGNQRPRELRARYRLVLGGNERMARLRGGEVASKPEKVSGHQVFRVSRR